MQTVRVVIITDWEVRMRAKTLVLCMSLLLGSVAEAYGGRLSFEEHAAVQESLSRVHPRMRARSI